MLGTGGMWFSGLFFRFRRSPNAMFFAGVLVGMFAFWILDARRASEYLLVRNMDVYKDIIAPQNFRNDQNSSHHAGKWSTSYMKQSLYYFKPRYSLVCLLLMIILLLLVFFALPVPRLVQLCICTTVVVTPFCRTISITIFAHVL